MRRRPLQAWLMPMAVAFMTVFPGCGSVDDDRIQAMAVSINISNVGMWNTYGVFGFGQHRRFILTAARREPAGFPYSQTSSTGFGGVLLISGIDPLSGDPVPLAYDLACPVERRPDVRVDIESELYEAVCPACGSHYDVTMAGGAPLSGPAAEGKYKYALRRYKVLAAADGGYLITY